MTTRFAALLGALGVLGVLGVAPAHAGAVSDDQPSLSLSRGEVRVDSDVEVAGRGLSPGSLVSAVLCGNDAQRGSLDCALGSTVEVGVQEDGSFATSMRVSTPPMPCPCVVVASGGTPEQLVAPLRIKGHPVLRGRTDRHTTSGPQAQVEVVGSDVESGTSVAGWFGLPATRTLTVRLANGGSLAAVPRLQLGWGEAGAEPTNFVQVPRLSALAPGSSTTVEVPVQFDALANGRLVVAGSVLAGGEDAAVAEAVTIRPWGLFAIVGVLLLGLGLRILTLVVRRRSVEPENGHQLSLDELLGSVWPDGPAVGNGPGPGPREGNRARV